MQSKTLSLSCAPSLQLERKLVRGGTVSMGDRELVIRFPYDPYAVEVVRSIPGREYENATRNWYAPLCFDSVATLRGYGFEIRPDVQQWCVQWASGKKKAKPALPPIPGLKATLMPFQEEAMQQMIEWKGNILLALDMGLGKTLISLAWLQLHKEARPAVVVCPVSVKYNWLKEAKKWMDRPQVQVLEGRKATPLHGDIIILNYDILQHWADALIAIRPHVVVLDECHKIKAVTIRTKASRRVCKVAKNRLLLSGTPIENRPDELYNAIALLDPSLFSSRFAYRQRYCAMRWTPHGWDYKGSSNTKELHDILVERIMFRRMKTDVLKDLPEMRHTVVPIDVHERLTAYREAEEDLISWLEERNAEKAARAEMAPALVRIEVLKQLALEAKWNACIDWFDDFLDQGEKLVVFTMHKVAVQRLRDKYKDACVYIDGDVSAKDRLLAVERFRTNTDVRLFIGNIHATGEGIDGLQGACSNAVFLELPWNPAKINQGASRIHRIGQRDAVNIWYLIATSTIEEDIAEILDEKKKVIDAVLDGKDTDEQSLLIELMNRLRKRR